jgi:AhpD family alkylhydroperoxidase
MKSIKEYNEYRACMNEIILADAPLAAKRFFSLDGLTYQNGALPAATKDLIGLSCSMVMRCDDCVTYHLEKCVELGVKDEEIWEAMSVALVVGGSITIPHLRRAVERLNELRSTSGTE